MILIKKGTSDVSPWYWSQRSQLSKKVNYEAYFDINYFNKYLDRINEQIKRCLCRAAYSKGNKSTQGALKVLVEGNKKFNGKLQSIGKPKLVVEAHANDVENLILEHFKQRYDILAGEGYSRGYVVDRDGDVDYNLVSHWKISGNGTNILASLLNIMAIEGVVLPGDYLVSL